MTLTYELTPDDYAAYCAHHYSRKGGGRRLLTGMRYGVPVFWFLLVLWSALSGHLNWVDWALLVLGLAWLLFFPKWVQRSSARRMRRIAAEGIRRDSVGPRQLDVTAAGIVEATPFGRLETFWRGIEKCVETPAHILIYTGPHAAYIVPKRALADNGEGLRTTVEALLRQAVV